MKRALMTIAMALSFALALPLAGHAQEDDDAPLVTAPKIIDALTAKDIVIDQPGKPQRPRRDPSISLRVQFAFGAANLTSYGQRQLDELALALNDKALSGAGFELAGHTDRVGDNESNMRLSLARANAVKQYLMEVHGLPAQRLQTIGYGYTRLANPADPAAAVNRRVEVRRIGTRMPAPLQDEPSIQPVPPPSSEGGRLVPTPR